MNDYYNYWLLVRNPLVAGDTAIQLLYDRGYGDIVVFNVTADKSIIDNFADESRRYDSVNMDFCDVSVFIKQSEK